MFASSSLKPDLSVSHLRFHQHAELFYLTIFTKSEFTFRDHIPNVLKIIRLSPRFSAEPAEEYEEVLAADVLERKRDGVLSVIDYGMECWMELRGPVERGGAVEC